jgi:hypothetical protein
MFAVNPCVSPKNPFATESPGATSRKADDLEPPSKMAAHRMGLRLGQVRCRQFFNWDST